MIELEYDALVAKREQALRAAAARITKRFCPAPGPDLHNKGLPFALHSRLSSCVVLVLQLLCKCSLQSSKRAGAIRSMTSPMFEPSGHLLPWFRSMAMCCLELELC